MFRPLTGIILMVACAAAWATDVSGPVSGTWTSAGNPYIIVGDTYVPSAQILEIESGVQVVFQGAYRFKVDSLATLRAIGTEQDSIRFSAAYPATGWKGIRFHHASDSSELRYCHLLHGRATGGLEEGKGGGIYLYYSSPRIQFSTIEFCWAEQGGGGISLYVSNALIEHNVIASNYSYDEGGGICIEGYAPTIKSNIIRNNLADGYGYWFQLGGGGIFVTANNAQISENEIYHNYSFYEGGGIEVFRGTYSLIEKNVIYLNGTTFAGGGISVHNWEGEQTHATILGNTLAANDCFIGEGSGILVHGLNVIVTALNNIVWGNTGGAQISDQEPTHIWVSYSDVQGGYWGTGNIYADPLFVNPFSHDYHLQWGSPCIDSGDPNPIYNDPDGTRADMGAFYFDQSGQEPPVVISYYPTNLDTVQQGIAIDFGIQAYDPNGDSLSYHWTMNGTLIGNNSTVIIQFANLGSYIIRAVVTDGMGSDSVQWNATVVSENNSPVIISYFPVDLDTVTLGTQIEFGIRAVDPNGDSLTYFWVEHQQQVWWEPNYTITFDSLGTNLIWAFVTDGALFDSMSWLVEVIASGALEINPESSIFGLGLPHPNPFNSTTVIQFELAAPQRVTIEVFDIHGCQMNAALGGQQEVWYPPGNHQVALDGSTWTSGIYLYRIRVGSIQHRGKIVLLK